MNTLFNLTAQQKNIWNTQMFYSNSSINNIGGYVNIEQKVDFNALEKAINLFVQHTDSIRYHFIQDANHVSQYESPYVQFKTDISNVNDINELNALGAELLGIPFDIIDHNLFKFTIFRFPNGHGGFIGIFHHLICDAWSMGLLISRIMDIYSMILKSEDNIADYPSYSNYIASNEQYLNSNKFEKDKEFWDACFEKEPEHAFIYNEKNNIMSIPNADGAREICTVDNDLSEKISLFCKENNASIYSFFMAIYLLYLSKINNTSSATIGTPVLNRSNFNEKQIFGMFVSNVPFKINIDSGLHFTDFLKNVTLHQSSVFRHQKYPYLDLLEDIKDKFDLSENLYDFVLSYQNIRDNKDSCDVPYSSSWFSNNKVGNSIEAHFYDMDNSGKVNIYYNYQTSKFSSDDINNFHLRIVNMAIQALNNPIIKDIPIITDEEKSFVDKFNDTDYEYNKDESLTHIFERQVRKNGSAASIIFKGNIMSYEELDKESNKLANLLISRGVKTGDCIGIMFNRSFNLSIAMWGIIKSGATFMLIDPSLPEDRISYMLSNANVKFVITDLYLNYKVLSINERESFSNTLPKVDYDMNDRFCVLYTSGSTGKPKGVELRCVSLVNLVNSFKEILHTNNCNVYLSTSAVSFDMFIVENFLSILSGKVVVLADENEQKIPAFTSKLIIDNDVDFIVSTPSKISLLLDTDCLKKVKVIQLGGEALEPTLYKALRAVTNADIHNGYGPSECFACSSNKLVTDENDVNIGKPYLNVKMYIMNKDNNIMPVEVPGELVITGDGVGLGYVGRERFNGFYRTGDMAKLSSSGELIYLGRKDHQIKLHGLRIELDEITTKLINLSSIKNAVTVIKKVNGIDSICSYVTLNIDNEINETNIKIEMSKVLPNYMVPAHIVFMDNLPITSNGKVDVHNLPDITVKQEDFVPCITNAEKNIEKILLDILHIEKISSKSNLFELGLDSLGAIRLVSEVYTKFNIKIEIKDIFDYPSICELAKLVDGASSGNELLKNSSAINYNSSTDVKLNAPIDMSSFKKDTDGIPLLPTSFAEKRIFYTCYMDQNQVTYNTPFGILFNQVPNVEKLENAINIIINKHQAFRTSFVLNDGEIYQKIADKIDFKLQVRDANNKDFVKPFDLSKAPLMHIELDTFDEKALLQVDIHHIICDGGSIQIFAKELCDLYNSTKIDKTDNIQNIDYLDYVLCEKINDIDKKYWISKFESGVPLLNMPTQFERASNFLYDGSNIYGKLENAETINNFCKANGITPYMFLLSCFYVLLYKYTMQNDIVVGSPVSGRDDARFSNVIGMFVNTIALRQSIQSSNSFIELAKMVRNNCLEAFSHQNYPFDELVKNLNAKRDTSRHPIFDVMFIYESAGLPALDMNGLNGEYILTESNTSKFDFSLEITPYEDYYNIRLEYATSLFGKDFMNEFLDCYKRIINIVIETPEILISKIKMVSNVPDTYLALDVPKDLRVIDLFEKQVLETPNKIALVFGDESYTYKELEVKVNRLANYIKSLPVYKTILKDEHRVIGIMMNRRSELLVSMLAALKVGCGYLPIDPTYPEDRISYIIEDSHIKLIITESGLNLGNETKVDGQSPKSQKAFGVKSICVDSDNCYSDYNAFDTDCSPSDVCYMIYTSGSTGRPKGVILKQSSVVNFIYGALHCMPIQDKTIVSITTMSFDIFVLESLLPVCSGMKVVMANNDEQNNPILLNKLCLKNGVQVIQTTPSKFKFLMSDVVDYIKNMEFVSLAGEPFPLELYKDIKKISNARVFNMYGPTETTVGSTFKEITSTKEKVSIGTPIANTSIYILDNDLNHVPVNVPGKLYIGGAGVSIGYMNLPELTATRYIDYNGDRIYDSGDLVKMLPNGELLCLGRSDFQVKVRGLRIELSEIESDMCSYGSISDAVVCVKNINDRDVLCGFFTSSGRVSISLLKKYLSSRLPNYMVPTYLMQLKEFSYTPNGKIDRKNLPTPTVTTREMILPKNDIENKILNIWKEILSIDAISTTDNFFDIGGDSLCALKMQLELMKIGYNIQYGDIFKNTTITDLADFIESRDKDNSDLPTYTKNDFKTINKFIHKNSRFTRLKLKRRELKNVLLLGATGFLGIHVLAELLKVDDIKIYCLIREDPSTSPENKLKNKFKYYFGSDLSNLFGTRLFIINGDVTFDNFGLAEDQYELLGSRVSTVVNCAALVKHYGDYKDFEKVNVIGSKNVVTFCEKFDKELFHTSTVSVSGNTMTNLASSFNPNKKVYFGESDLFVNQTLDNVYVRSKFEAEKFIIEELAKGKLRGIILRIGNITNRFIDGKFQENSAENAFLNRFKAFLNIGMFPESMLKNYIEFTPVDILGEAIVNCMKYDSYPVSVLHLYNSKHLYIDKLYNMLVELEYKIKITDDDTFKKALKKSFYSKTKSDKVNVLLNDLDSDSNLVYKTNLVITNKFTLKFFKKIGFEWPEIDIEYIKKVLKNL